MHTVLSFPDWTYYLNSAGSELPLILTNEMSRKLNGSVVESFLLPKYNQFRLHDSYSLRRFTIICFFVKYVSFNHYLGGCR